MVNPSLKPIPALLLAVSQLQFFMNIYQANKNKQLSAIANVSDLYHFNYYNAI